MQNNKSRENVTSVTEAKKSELNISQKPAIIKLREQNDRDKDTSKIGNPFLY